MATVRGKHARVSEVGRPAVQAERAAGKPGVWGKSGASGKTGPSSASAGKPGSSRAPANKFDLTQWVETHAGASVVLLALACAAALLLLFYFTVFTDFSASADFVYTQF